MSMFNTAMARWESLALPYCDGYANADGRHGSTVGLMQSDGAQAPVMRRLGRNPPAAELEENH